MSSATTTAKSFDGLAWVWNAMEAGIGGGC